MEVNLEDSEYLDKLSQILVWANEHDEFNPDFVVSLSDQVGAGKRLSDRQKEAIDNIIVKFRINE